MLAALVAALAVPASAQASGAWQQAIRDCANDGRLHQQYSQSALQQALRHLPPDIAEYTDCYDVLRAALTGPGSGGSGGPNSSVSPGSVTPTSNDLNALRGIQHGGAPSLKIGGRPVTPGSGGLFHLASRTAENRLPTPLFWSLVALAAMGAFAGLVALRPHLLRMRGVAARILRR
jgi:hypothetical protein